MSRSQSARGPDRVGISDAKKQRWFDRGVRALAEQVLTPAHPVYACPLCLFTSTNVNAFTVEDVPPRRVGGKPLVLTCEPCNSFAGRTYDFNWGNLVDVDGFMQGEISEPLTMTMDVEGAKATIETTAFERTFKSKIIEKASNMAAVEKLKAALKDGYRPTTVNVKLNKSRFHERHARLSILRAGYLASFAVMGYQFLPSWEPVRMSILDPNDGRDLTRLVRYERDKPAERRELGIVYEPKEFWSVYVGFSRWSVFVPLAVDSAWYRPAEWSGSFPFRGHNYVWPVEPTYGIKDSATS